MFYTLQSSGLDIAFQLSAFRYTLPVADWVCLQCIILNKTVSKEIIYTVSFINGTCVSLFYRDPQLVVELFSLSYEPEIIT